MATLSKPSGDFEKFEALARRILTTPKSELVKGKANAAKPAAKKRK